MLRGLLKGLCLGAYLRTFSKGLRLMAYLRVTFESLLGDFVVNSMATHLGIKGIVIYNDPCNDILHYFYLV